MKKPCWFNLVLVWSVISLWSSEAFAWGGAHRRMTEAAIARLPEWQRAFIGDQTTPLCLEYCLYPDHYYGERKKIIDPYIMPELRTYVMPMHLDATDEINEMIFNFYVGKALELLRSPHSRVDGFRFIGTFLHMLQDRGAIAHSIPTDNFFEVLAQFMPISEGKAVWMHSAMENLDAEYTSGLPGYKPRLLGKDRASIVQEIKIRLRHSREILAPLVIPLAESIYKGDTVRSIELQIVAANVSTALVADFLYTVIAVAQNRIPAKELSSIIASPDVRVMEVEYDINKIAPFYREKFTWGKGYQHIARRALSVLDERLKRQPISPELPSLIEKYVYLPDIEGFENSNYGKKIGLSSEQISGMSIHMPIDLLEERKMLTTIIRLATEALSKGEWDEGAKMLGIVSHIISDRYSPVDLTHQSYYCYRFRFLLPPPKHIDIWDTGSFLAFDRPLGNEVYTPGKLGDTPEEIAFRLQLAFSNKALPLGRSNFIRLLNAFYKEDSIEIWNVQHLLADHAARLTADLFYTVLSGSSSASVFSGFKDRIISLVDVPEHFSSRVPTVDPQSVEKNAYGHYWRLRWNRPYSNRLWKNTTGALPTDTSFIKPLKILENGVARTVPKGFIQDTGPEHTFFIPEGVYAEFRAKVGYHPDFEVPDDAGYQFEVILDGVSAYKSPVIRKGMDASLISVPLGRARSIALQVHHERHYKGNLVWADPVLIR